MITSYTVYFTPSGEYLKRWVFTVYWGDETGLRTDSPHARGYAPKGQTPVLRLKINRESLNMISAVTKPRESPVSLI